MKNDKFCVSKTLTYLIALVVAVVGAFYVMNYTNTQKIGGTPKAAASNALTGLGYGEQKVISSDKYPLLFARLKYFHDRYTATVSNDESKFIAAEKINGTRTQLVNPYGNMTLKEILCPGYNTLTSDVERAKIKYLWNGRAGALAKCTQQWGQVYSLSVTGNVAYVACGAKEVSMSYCNGQVLNNANRDTVGDVVSGNISCPPSNVKDFYSFAGVLRDPNDRSSGKVTQCYHLQGLIKTTAPDGKGGTTSIWARCANEVVDKYNCCASNGKNNTSENQKWAAGCFSKNTNVTLCLKYKNNRGDSLNNAQCISNDNVSLSRPFGLSGSYPSKGFCEVNVDTAKSTGKIDPSIVDVKCYSTPNECSNSCR